jgi:hypothetical protein
MAPRQSFRSLLGAFVFLLTAVAHAAPGETGICAPPFANDSDVRSTVIQPLLPEQRLIYSIDRFQGGTLEVRYRVNGALHLTEMIDLDQLELPLTREPKESVMAQKRQNPGEAAAAPVPRRGARAEVERAVELLTIAPDTVRELHRLASEGAVIEIEVRHNGSAVEALSFAGLTGRAAALVKQGFVPVAAQAEVSGPGLVAPARTSRVTTEEYLESCSECTYAHPCNTECGWDPGKGGPVTCGENGAPCGGEPTCTGSTNMGEWWGPWTYYSTSLSGWWQCVSNGYGGDRYNERIYTYKRDRIRRTKTCPNAPSCTGCYDTDEVISVQYSQSSCYENSYYPCSFPVTPCCSRTTCTGFFNPCSNNYSTCW